jgi:hypothetical protein
LPSTAAVGSIGACPPSGGMMRCTMLDEMIHNAESQAERVQRLRGYL